MKVKEDVKMEEKLESIKEEESKEEVEVKKDHYRIARVPAIVSLPLLSSFGHILKL